jgi:hypothetical protein
VFILRAISRRLIPPGLPVPICSRVRIFLAPPCDTRYTNAYASVPIRRAGEWDDGAPAVAVKRNPGIRAKALGWIKRYGLPEVAGTLMAYWGYFTAHGATRGNEVASAYAASVCETLGFFSVVIIRQVIADRARAVRRLHNYGWSGAGKTIRNLVMEFGVPEIVDTGFIRPLAMGTAAHFFGAGWGIAVGKIVSDISFFLPAIMLHELQKKWARAEARSLVSVSGTAAAPDELENRMDALHKSDVFGGVSEEDIEFFASMFDRRDLADGEVLCAKGDVATEIYVVKDGVVEVRVKSDGPPLATLGRSTVLGDAACSPASGAMPRSRRRGRWRS